MQILLRFFKSRKIFYYLPRVLSIFFILFLGLFALDVFEMGKFEPAMVVGFIVHLIPNFLLLAILLIAWKSDRIGGILFIILSLLFTIFFRTYSEPMTFLLISLPVFMIGVLFLISDFRKS